MLRWTVVFLLIALIAGVFGFYGLEGTAMWIAKVLFVVFLIFFIISLVMGRRGPLRNGTAPWPDEGAAQGGLRSPRKQPAYGRSSDRFSALELQDALNLDGDVAGERAHSHRAARPAPPRRRPRPSIR